MTGILAIDTATEACSVALWHDGQVEERFELAARQHSQRLFGMLRELLPTGKLCDYGVDVIAWGCGPGSFTGLRIAAAAVQGLAYANDLPVVAISTLACQAQTALREGVVDEGDTILSTLDARINEIYAAAYRVDHGLPVPLSTAVACAPDQLTLWPGDSKATAVGSGCEFVESFPPGVREGIRRSVVELLPHACDLVDLACEKFSREDVQQAREVQPVYVRDEISWKKIPEQGKRK